MSLALLPDLVRLVWSLFFLGIWIGRLCFVQFFSPISSIVAASSRNTHSISANSYDKDFSISSNLLPAYLVVAFSSFLFTQSGFGVSDEYAGQLNTGSKSLVPYLVTGISSIILNFWTWSIIISQRLLQRLEFQMFVNRFLPVPVFLASVGSLVYLQYLASYGLRIITPILTFICYRFFDSLAWRKVKSSLFSFRVKVSFMLIFTIAILLFATGFLVFRALGLSFGDLLLLKILGRADSYELLSQSNINELISVYSGNLLYFFHPFLKAIGLKAYDMPMGTWLISGSGANLSQIGGPNVHLPIVLYILAGGAPWGVIAVFIGGMSLSIMLLKARNILVCRMNGDSSVSLYWPIFFFFGFPLLITEPSAFGHQIFFASIVYGFLRCFFCPYLKVVTRQQ
jgi:hypothetical protein